MTTSYLKSPAAAKLLGITYSTLCNLIRTDRLKPPAKDSSGDYVWSAEDLDRARQALAMRRAMAEQQKEAARAS